MGRAGGRLSAHGAAALVPLGRFLDALDVLHSRRSALGATIRVGRVTLPGEGWTLDGVSDERRDLADRACRFDGEWLLSETYERRRAELNRRGGDASAVAALDAASIALRQFLGVTSRMGLRQPTAYYAILVLDGDRMGRWVSGDQHRVTLGEALHPDARAMVTGDADWDSALGDRRLFGPPTHAALGAILRDFALWVVPYVVEREHGGRVVYAGGDDVLALLPAHCALDAVEGLRARYTSAFLTRDALGDLHELPQAADPDLVVFRGMGPDATVSAGLLFAHHLLPLGLALDEARRLEHQSKGGGRDAVAVGVARRSGPDDELVVVSRHSRGGTPITSLVATARALLSGPTDSGGRERGAASSRLPYLLREAAPVLDQLTDPAARRRAIMAVANRHVAGEDGRRRLLGLYDALATLPPASSERAAPLAPPSRPVDELARLLCLARFLEAGT
ncbi:MAG: type III-B CRISPR-associated protein Cas10/Cmr2 [Chloroflexi bacterium]|nr:type III-B CRISPR-associated protein Cas10/Cmr2 [Chloroflexota bacterium]